MGSSYRFGASNPHTSDFQRPSHDRTPSLASLGHAHRGWFDVTHHFSFAGYQDPARMRWASCAPGTTRPRRTPGFPPLLHTDVEIITCVAWAC